MGQVVSNGVSSCTTSNEDEERSSRSGNEGSISTHSSTTTASSSSLSLLHPFAALLTTITTTTDDDHSNNQNRGIGEAVHGNHATTASIVKQLVTISHDYNFVEKKSTENIDHGEAALVLEPLAQHKHQEKILVVEKVLDDNQNNGGAKEVQVTLVGMHEESTTTATTTIGTVTHSPSSAAPLSTLHPSAVVLTSTQSSSFDHDQEDYHDETVAVGIMKNVVTISAHCNDFVSPNIEDDDGTPLLELAAKSQSLPLPQQEEEILVIKQVLDDKDDEHLNNQDNGEGDQGGAKEGETEVVVVVVQKDDMDKEKSIITNCTNYEQNNKIILAEERVIKHYSSYHKILIVGDGDFSFSSCLASYFHSANNMVATSLDSQELLWSKYSRAKQHVEELRLLGCQVLHGVDVHVMDSHPELKRMRFDRIVYNFPHAGHFCLHETQSSLIAMHQKLLLGFFKSASKMLVDEGGEVHVSHRDDHPYNRWEIIELAEKAGLALKDKVVFRESDYPGYNNKRGGAIRSDETFPLGYYSFTFKFMIISSLH